MDFPTGIRRGAVVPGQCIVPQCNNPEVIPANGMCMVHNSLIHDFLAWLDDGIAADSWNLWSWSDHGRL